MIWVNLAFGLLKFVNSLIDWAKKKGYINEGRRQAFEEEATRLLNSVKKTEDAQKDVETWDDSKLDDFLTKP